MNIKMIDFLKKSSYTITSNLISMAISAIVIFIVPKIIGVNEYGYWQLYLFYSSYVGFLHFGWNDGIYLRYGGYKYEELNKHVFFVQFYMLLLMQFSFLILMYWAAEYFSLSDNRSFILQMIAICMLIINVRYMLLYILQGTYRIKEYARIIIFDRIIYFFLVVILLAIKIDNFKLLIFADLIGKFVSLLLAIYFCKDIVFSKITSFYFDIKEVKANISVGIKLMFANIASKLILGIARFGIERTWSVAIFGKISLTLSISSLILTLINAVGLVLFPILRRTDQKSISTIYRIMHDFLMVILFTILLFYYPIKVILTLWLPEYIEGLMYMAFLFPMLVYEGKNALLINTFLKTLRKENIIFHFNFLTMLISAVLTIISTTIIKNLNIAILFITITLAIRGIIGEIYIFKYLKINLYKDIILELILTVVFIILAWNIENWFLVLKYGLIYSIYLLLKKRDLKNSINNLKLLIGS